jgi:hypothetical protein
MLAMSQLITFNISNMFSYQRENKYNKGNNSEKVKWRKKDLFSRVIVDLIS